jgi:hypothetical protein
MAARAFPVQGVEFRRYRSNLSVSYVTGYGRWRVKVQDLSSKVAALKVALFKLDILTEFENIRV